MNTTYTIFQKLVSHHKSRSVFTIFIFFLLAFGLSRMFVYFHKFGFMPYYPFDNIFGTHIHHFVFGIALVSLVGFISLALPHPVLQSWRPQLSALYGFGLGWIMDEFGMWLHLEDNYYMRLNYDAIIITAIILINFIYFSKIWKNIFYKIFRQFK